MEWHLLHSNERIVQSISRDIPSLSRHSYQKDFDRIIFSTAFRRLQDKTQVFPLPGPTFVHNRLTHSLEVASVGRSLAERIGQELCVKYGFDELNEQFYLYQFPWVISSACLAHDIGNPPFGHSGEDAIRHFFRKPPQLIHNWLHENLSTWTLQDLTHFEGNSMAFRFLTQKKSQYHSDLNLTLSTIASIIKYPCSSLNGFKKDTHFTLKKSNYFSSEADAFKRITEHFDLPIIDKEHNLYARHPFVYLTEAADDICYTIIDLEDAHRLKIITCDKYIDMLLPFFSAGEGIYKAENIKNKLKDFHLDDQKVSYLRAMWIGRMIELTTAAFMKNEQAIIKGLLDRPILQCLDESIIVELKSINEFSSTYVYKHHDSVGIELSGFHILYAILDQFMQVIIDPNSSKSKLFIAYLQWNKVIFSKDVPAEDQVMYILDFITASTDNFVMDLYKRLQAIL